MMIANNGTLSTATMFPPYTVFWGYDMDCGSRCILDDYIACYPSSAGLTDTPDALGNAFILLGEDQLESSLCIS